LLNQLTYPQLVGTVGSELAIYPIQWARQCLVRHGRLDDFAAPHSFQPKLPHQSLDRAARHRHSFSAQLPPDLIGAIHLEVGMPYALNLWDQYRIVPGTCAA